MTSFKRTQLHFWLTLAALGALVLLPLELSAETIPVAWSFEDGDGDDKLWLCQQPRNDDDTRGVLTVDASGYFSISTIDNTMFDSGDHQRNESYFLLIKNSRNPEGYPVDPNCDNQYILLDRTALPAHLGTFYLVEGEENIVEMHHYCDLWRNGQCTQFFDPEGEGGGGCKNCESVSLMLDTLKFDRRIDFCEDPTITRRPADDWCDGIDNDCDNLVDEDDVECAMVCDNTGTERCDGVDNNCDGTIDEGVLCSDGFRCSQGGCRSECVESCVDGSDQCIDGLCVPGPCGPNGDVCADHETCAHGSCIDFCEDVACAPGTVCRGGACIDPTCHTEGCGLYSQVCIEGTCLDDPCLGVSCGADEFCRAGACVGSCANIDCGAGESCQDGVCRVDACADVSCPTGEVCRYGACHADACSVISCPGNLICEQGRCMGDPCDSITCNAGEACAMGQCLAASDVPAANGGTAADGLPGGNNQLDAGGDCTCSSVTANRKGSRTPLGLALVLVAAFGVFVVRRLRA